MAVFFRNLPKPALLVALAWIAGVVVLGAAYALPVRAVQEFWLELAVLIWLAPLALYDLRRKEVPHMACVVVPCFAAVVHAFAVGAWQLGAVGALAIAASERDAIRHMRARRWLLCVALTLACLLALGSGEVTPGAIAILGFWVAYELGWWAGADALVAITLALLWPDIRLLVLLGIVHIGVAVSIHVLRWWRGARLTIFGLERVPGLPVIYLTVLLRALWSFI